MREFLGSPLDFPFAGIKAWTPWTISFISCSSWRCSSLYRRSDRDRDRSGDSDLDRGDRVIVLGRCVFY